VRVGTGEVSAQSRHSTPDAFSCFIHIPTLNPPTHKHRTTHERITGRGARPAASRPTGGSAQHPLRRFGARIRTWRTWCTRPAAQAQYAAPIEEERRGKGDGRGVSSARAQPLQNAWATSTDFASIRASIYQGQGREGLGGGDSEGKCGRRGPPWAAGWQQPGPTAQSTSPCAAPPSVRASNGSRHERWLTV